MKITVEPRSDQWNADDFIGGPRTFTIANVKVGAAEQKYDIELVEGEGRVWRPPMTMLRLLVAAWGDEASTWAGRRVTLYRDTSVRFGKDAVGGVRISHMSDLPDGKPFRERVTVSRGKREFVGAEPLTESAPTPQPVTDDTLAELKALFTEAGIPTEQQLPGVNSIINGSVTALNKLTEEQAQVVLGSLRKRVGR